MDAHSLSVLCVCCVIAVMVIDELLECLWKLSIHEVEDNPSSHLLVMKGAPERILDRYFLNSII